MKKILFGFMALALLAGCSNDDMPDVGGADSLTDTPITFNIEVADATSRAGYAAGELTEGTLGFCMQTAGTDALSQAVKEKYNGVNRKVECVNGKWTIDGNPLLWRNVTDEVSWQAYYPYTESNVTDGILTITIPTDQERDGVYDLLYGKGTTTGMASINGIDVGLKHMFSKLLVNLYIGSELENAEVESVVLTGMHTIAYFNLLTGHYEGNLEMPANINMKKHEDGKTFEAIILSYIPKDMGFEITLSDSRKFFYKQANPVFEDGMIHTLNIRIGKDKVDLAEGGITVGNWGYENGGADDFIVW